jgi:cell division protein FtsB
VSEDAAQKRVSRALDKLRDLLSRRGITTTAAALSILLSAKAVQAAPAGLAVTISSAAALSGSTLATTATATKAIAMTTMQKTLIFITAVAAGVTTPLVIQHYSQVKLRAENQSLRQQVDQLAQLTAENERLSNLVARSNQPRPLPVEPSRELLRLRGEVGLLRQQNQELAKRLIDQQQPTASFEPSSSWADAGNATPEAAVETYAWAIKAGNKDKLAEVLMFEPEQTNTNPVALAEELSQGLQPLISGIEASRLLFKDYPAPDEVTLWFQDRFTNGLTLVAPVTLKRFSDQWKVKLVVGAGEAGN